MAYAIHYILRAVPLTCFSLALFSDIAYLQTSNLLWLHFSEWLLLVGVVFCGLALLALPIDLLIRRVRPSWWAVLFGVIVLLLAIWNNLVHTADGWTAIMPIGVALSAATVIAMMLTGILGSRREKHV